MMACPYKRGRIWQAKIKLDSWPKERRFSLGTANKRVADTKLAKLLQDFEMEAAGLLPPLAVRQAAEQPVLTLLADFLNHLRSVDSARNTSRIYNWAIRKLVSECGWNYLRDVTSGSFEAWQRESSLSGKTKNDVLGAANRFFRWLRKPQRVILENPLEFLKPVNTRKTARQYRRALTWGEVLRLLATAPYPRNVIYRMAVETGARRGDLKKLRWADVTLFTNPKKEDEVLACAMDASGGTRQLVEADVLGGSIRLSASASKNGKTTLQPIGPELAAELWAMRPPDAAPFQLIFTSIPKVETFKRDLARAGIAFLDEHGRRMDFHALRNTYGTALVLSGADPRVVMEAMRHSDLKLTMKVYMDAQQLTGPVAAAVAKLPWNNQ